MSPNVQRRDFLKLVTSGLLAASGALGLGALTRFLGSQPEVVLPTEFDLGSAQQYPPGTKTLLTDIPALLIHDENGFSARSLTCTHLGCTVEEQAGGFICPCHGSRYDDQGNITHGPATTPLAALRVETTSDGHVWVFLS